jgi:Domain of unknown function (DUF4149)
MTTFFRILRLLSLVAWVGGLIFFVAGVTRVAFATMPDAHNAGLIVRGTLIVLHHIGFLAGAIYLVSTLTLIATQRDSHLVRALEVLVVLVMLAITGYSQFSVLPRMEADRLSLGGIVDQTTADVPAHRHFDRLHGLSVKLEGTVLFSGLLLVCLAPLPRRDDLDRVQF